MAFLIITTVVTRSSVRLTYSDAWSRHRVSLHRDYPGEPERR